jgi:prepilin-type N-terminal cleavage/methylation domain-containing protein
MRGFTLLELLVAIAIAAILFAITVSGFRNLREETNLPLAVDDAVSYLQDARARTLSSEGATVYGVHFETGMFVFFIGPTYTAGAPTNKERDLPPTVTISSYSFSGGGDEVIFKRLTGETDNSGTVTFQLTSDPSHTRTIDINLTGFATIQ